MASTVFDSLAGDQNAGNVILTTDTLYVMLTSGYSPNAATHAKRSDVTGEVTGTGYSAGGIALSGVTSTTTQANSWATARANSTAYALGDIVRPATGNGFLYRAEVAGTSGGSIPSYPTVVGTTVADGGVTWLNVGTAATVVTATNPSWASSTISATGAVIYKHRGGASSADNLVSYADFGGTVASTAAAFTITTFATVGFFTLTKV